MVKKSITTDELARMVQKGFENTATADDVAGVYTRLDKIDTRLDRIENILIRAHENRIERLEDKMRVMEVAFSRMPTKK